MPADIGKRRVEGVDAMGYAGEIRMERNGHDAAGLRSLTVEHVELPADHVAKFFCRAVRPLEHGLVVDLLTVWHREDLTPAIERHDIGLIVVGPVADILASCCGKKIERVPGLLQTGAQPADRSRARCFLDGCPGAMHDALFIS